MKMQIRDFFESGQPTNSQLKQDLFVLYHYQDTPGFFVEFGGLDGIDTSNTYLLEKDHGWTGIIVEPLPRFKDDLIKNRQDFKHIYSVDKTEQQMMNEGGYYKIFDCGLLRYSLKIS